MKHLFKITPAQLKALIDITDTIEAMVGCGDEDFNKEGNRNVKLVDRMLKNNGYKRKNK